jgi:outer membrane protein assembly factor BamB
MKLTVQDIKTLKSISQIAGLFTMTITLLMVFSFIQLKTIKPLDNPVLVSVKEQYDRDPENVKLSEQVRAMDLMARKAYFSSRRQVETGSYLLIAGALIFVLCQRLMAGSEKLIPVIPGSTSDQNLKGARYRKYLLSSATFLTATAVILSFFLRGSLPDLAANSPSANIHDEKKSADKSFSPSDFKVVKFSPDKVNFPSFRGEDSRGFAGDSEFPTEWNGESGKNILWKFEVPNKGKSSPVIWGDKVFITGADDNICEVYCLDKNSGKLLWTSLASGIQGEPAELPKIDQEAGLAVSTVAVNDKTVCAIFSNGNLACFDHDGKKKWAINIGTPENIYGYSSSLIIYKDILIVQFDSDKKLSLMGFDTGSGEMKWETLRTGRPVWSSPVISEFSGDPQVILNGNPAVSAYDPRNGKLIWAVDCMSGDVAPSVAVNSAMVYAVTDYAKLAAIRPGAGAAIVWEDNTYTPDVSSPVATDEFLFVATGYGDVACYNARKGDTLWTHYFMDQFYASPVIAGDKVYLLDRSGKMNIFRASAQFEMIGESTLGEPADCTPAFSGKNIYIRGKNNLYCISAN